MTNTQSTPAGWYPDTTTPGQLRWWDGAQWTEHTQVPYDASGPAGGVLRAPEGTVPGTTQVWAIVGLFGLLQVVGIVYSLTFDVGGYMNDSMANALSDTSNPFASYSYMLSPAYIIQVALTALVYGSTAALAYFDSKTLRSRGVQRPFPWWLAFIPWSVGTIVYVIGRSVIVRRRTGSGLSPLWVLIAIAVASFIITIVVSIVMVGSMFSDLTSYPGF